MIYLGICLSGKPYGGGTYQYNLSIISALKSLDCKKYKIIAFIYDDAWYQRLPDNFDVIKVSNPKYLKLLNRVYRFLDRTSEGVRRFSSFLNPMVKKINLSKCSLVIYPSQDAASYQTNKKSLSTIHDLMHRYEGHFKEYQGRVKEKRDLHYSMMCKQVDGILVDSNVGKQHVIESYAIDESKIFVQSFVPPMYLKRVANIDVRKKYKLPDQYFFYPAQFWEHKNHINLLDAVKIIKNKGFDIHLVLAGSKENNYNQVVSKIKNLELIENISILGYVNDDEMASLYKNSIATVFVSFIGPTNIPPLEALMLGCPLICSNAYAMPEQTKGAALLVNPNNPKDIARKMLIILNTEKTVAANIGKGYEVIDKYGQDEFNKQLKKCIKKIIIKH